MTRRKRPPGPAPFIDPFGRPSYSNPLGRYRPNPELESGGATDTAPPRPPEPLAPISHVAGWEQRERHFDGAGLPTLGLHQELQPAPPAEPASTPEVASTPENAERVAELMRLLEQVTPATAPPSNEPPTLDTPGAPTAATRAARLAAREAVRRARTRTRLRRAGSIVVTGGAVFGVTAAYGFWTGGADAGSRTSKPHMLTVRAAATAGMPSSPLARGGTGNVKLQVDNPNAFPVTLVGVEGGPFPSAVHGGAGCTISNSGVTFTAPATLNVNIPAKSTAFVRLAGAASMGKGAAPECRAHTFTIPVSIRVRKA